MGICLNRTKQRGERRRLQEFYKIPKPTETEDSGLFYPGGIKQLQVSFLLGSVFCDLKSFLLHLLCNLSLVLENKLTNLPHNHKHRVHTAHHYQLRRGRPAWALQTHSRPADPLRPCRLSYPPQTHFCSTDPLPPSVPGSDSRFLWRAAE